MQIDICYICLHGDIQALVDLESFSSILDVVFKLDICR